MKYILSIILFATLLVSCSEESIENTTTDTTDLNEEVEQPIQAESLPDNFLITGNVQGGANTKLVVEVQVPQGVIKIAETQTDENGNFTLKGNVVDFGLYQLKVDEFVQPNTTPKFFPITLCPDDTVNIQVPLDQFSRKPVISGTEWAKPLNGYMVELDKFISFQENLVNPNQYTQEELVALVIKNKKSMDNYCRKEILKDTDNPGNIVLMTSLMPIPQMGGFESWDAKNLEALTAMKNGYISSYPDHPTTKSLVTQVDQVESGYTEFVAFKNMKYAPEIAFEDPEGKVRKLSDLRGKVVLIDFWASWCGPCRKENPNVVRLYNEYKSRGFEIFSVSLDKDLEAWKRAITADGLIWPNHVSDLKMWNSEVVSLYKIKGIPMTVLIDENGEIIESGLRGPALEQKLKEILG